MPALIVLLAIALVISLWLLAYVTLAYVNLERRHRQCRHMASEMALRLRPVRDGAGNVVPFNGGRP